VDFLETAKAGKESSEPSPQGRRDRLRQHQLCFGRFSAIVVCSGGQLRDPVDRDPLRRYPDWREGLYNP
jgi:hypothetical protein